MRKIDVIIFLLAFAVSAAFFPAQARAKRPLSPGHDMRKAAFDSNRERYSAVEYPEPEKNDQASKNDQAEVDTKNGAAVRNDLGDVQDNRQVVNSEKKGKKHSSSGKQKSQHRNSSGGERKMNKWSVEKVPVDGSAAAKPESQEVAPQTEVKP